MLQNDFLGKNERHNYLDKVKIIFLKLLLIFLSFTLVNTFGNSKNGDGEQKDKNVTQVKLGYSDLAFQDTKPQDANAAIYVWAETLKKTLYADLNLKLDLTASIYYSLDELKAALNKNELDILVLTSQQYFDLKEKYNLIPSLAGIIDDSPFLEYVLLTRKDSNFNNISDLRGKTLAQPKEKFNPLIDIWLESLLKRKNGETKKTFFKTARIEEKEPNAVYSVFFKKADCAIIQKSVFNTLCTLNPQFNSSLKIIATSPELLNIVTVYRKSSEKKVLDILHSLGANIQKTPEGQNIIKLFKIKRLVEITDKDLTSTKKLIDEYYKSNKK